MTYDANFNGAIAAANSLMSRQGFGIKDYPSNMGGLVDAILSLNIAQSNVGITPPQWMPVYDDDGHVTGDSWETPPANGTLWFDTRQGRLMVWVNDGFYQANGGDGLTSVAAEAPENPISGQTWYDTDTGSYFLWNGLQWLQLSGGEGSFGAISADIALLSNTVDELSVRRSTAREYEVSTISTSPTAIAQGQLGLSNSSAALVDRIAIAPSDRDGMISRQGTVDDIIDLEATNGQTSRYKITAVEADYYEVTYQSGAQTFLDTQRIKIFVYPQNSDSASVQYVDAQMGILQTQLDEKHQFFYDYSAPADSIVNNGDIWYDRDQMRLLVRDQTTWVNPDRLAAPPRNEIFYSDEQPTGSGLNNGDIWFNNSTLTLLVYHDNQWINPDRQSDDTHAIVKNAAENSSSFAEFKEYIISNF